MKYNLEVVQQFILNNEFEKLNQVINKIVAKEEHNFKDLEILKCILDSSSIAFESKEKLKILYLKYKKEIEERIFSGISSMNEETRKLKDEYKEFDIKPSPAIQKNSVFVNFKTTVLIVILTILLIAAISFMTLRG